MENFGKKTYNSTGLTRWSG